MTMTSLFFLAVIILFAGAVLIALTVTIRTYFRYRGERLITCPETRKPAAVHVAAGEVARETLLGHPHLRLDQCSRWPERQNCGQECLSQIEADPESCLVWGLVANWYKDKSCVYCQRPFGEIHWHDHPPALMAPDHKTVQWNEIPAEVLPEVFATHLPVCWSCHNAETFRREHPDLVVDRPWKRGAMGEFLSDEHTDKSREPKPSPRT